MIKFWTTPDQKNLLKGVENDPTNPIIVPDEYIKRIYFLSYLAKKELEELLPDLLPAEQARIRQLLNLQVPS